MIEIKNTTDSPEIISSRTLRITIGLLGMSLPIVLIIGAAILEGCQLTQNSISAYYHTIMRNYFVGSLCAVAICLFAYRGYSRTDYLAGRFAALFALGVAFFPTSVGLPATDCLPNIIEGGIYSIIHFASATLLFLLLAFFSLVLFTKHGPNPTKKKLTRNKIYRLCGWVIIACIALIALYVTLLDDKFPELANYRPVFVLEAVALIFFSISWLTKGEIILSDE